VSPVLPPALTGLSSQLSRFCCRAFRSKPSETTEFDLDFSAGLQQEEVVIAPRIFVIPNRAPSPVRNLLCTARVERKLLPAAFDFDF
jgi:hypothetical protein